MRHRARARWDARWNDQFLSDDTRRQLLGALPISLGLIFAWILMSRGSDGRITAWIYDLLHAIAGNGAFLIPLFLIMAGIKAILDARHPLPAGKQLAGGTLLGCSILALLAFAGETKRVGGGVIGDNLALLLNHYMTEWICALVLLIAGICGVFLLTRTDPRRLNADLHSIWRQLRTAPAPASNASYRLAETAAFLPQPRTAASRSPVSNDRLEQAPLPPPVTPPVINFPNPAQKAEKSDKKAKAPQINNANLPLPDITQLKYYEGREVDASELENKATLIEETLSSFKVDAHVREINPGPAVTQYTLEPGSGVKVRRITELQNDLALALAAPSIRIEAPVPGMARVGIEIPNEHVTTVGLRETIESSQFGKGKAKLPVPLGRDVNGRYVVGDLTKMPHLLIAGATGSGKSVCLNEIISTFLLTRSPDDVKLLMFDPKMVELTGYNGVPHLQCPVVTEMDKVVGALRLVVGEMQRRYDLFSKAGVRNLDGYRMKISDEPKAEKVPYLVVILDELADLMLTSPMDVEGLIQRLTQMGRAAGIHLILATQRPSVDVITGIIKANVPARIAFAVSSQTDSRVILDMPGAERLLGRGDMLYLPPDAAKPVRIQGAFVEDNDVHFIVGHWHAVTPIPQYAEEWLNLPSSSGVVSGTDGGYEDDPLMEKALAVVREQGVASASMLQRRLRIGYNRAARLIEQMEDDGIIGPADGIKGRPVLDME
ncbi:MAG TPA: DNA translocase FtsK 4TM domain-containing protein [Thermomicrobiales bacterium]|nr:DNA translocase FtsK 4TM domain-containing protein [Thermomicrobiales bacterium]